jgi:hypothetical protein
MFSARRGLQGLGQRGRLEPEIQEAGARNFYFLANISDLKSSYYVGGQLPRIHFASLS